MTILDRPGFSKIQTELRSNFYPVQSKEPGSIQGQNRYGPAGPTFGISSSLKLSIFRSAKTFDAVPDDQRVHPTKITTPYFL